MPGAMHEIAVTKILEKFPTARTKRLRAALRREFEQGDVDAEFFFSIGIPDAYMIDQENMTLVLFEVEVGNPVDKGKMERYCELYWALSWLHWDLRLITLNRWGQYAAEIDVGEFAIRKIVFETERSRPRKIVAGYDDMAERIWAMNP